PSPATYIWAPWLDVSPHKIQEPTPPVFEWRIGEALRIVLKQVLPGFLQTRLRAREIQAAEKGYAVMDRVPDANVERFRGDLETFVLTLRSQGVRPILVTHATIFGLSPADDDHEMLLAW